jgi:hypothetical protein
MLYLINPQPFSEAIIRRLNRRYETVYSRYFLSPFVAKNDRYTRAVHQLVQPRATAAENVRIISIASSVESGVKYGKITVALAVSDAFTFKMKKLIFQINSYPKNITKYIPERKPFYCNIGYNILEESSSVIIDGIHDIIDVLQTTGDYLRVLLETEVV